MSRRSFLSCGGRAVLGGGLAYGLFTGCGSRGANGDSLTYWSNLEESSQREYFTRNIERPFEEANGAIRMETTFQPAAELDRLVRTALQGRQGPDLVPTPGPAYAQEYMDARAFLPVDEYAEQYGWADRMLGWTLDLGRFEGDLYAIPYQLQTMLLYYNKTLFEEKGWKPPKNRDEMESLAEEMSGQGIVPFAAGIGDEPPSIEWFSTVFWNHYAGPEALYGALSSETPFSDPVFVEAIALFKDYVERGWFGGSRERFFSNGFHALHADLGSGDAAMCIEGSWLLANIGTFFGDGNDWDWAPLPPLREDVPGELYELGVGSTLAINRRTERADEAAAFMNYLVADRARAAGWMADVPAAFNAPLPFEESDFPKSMDGRVARQISALSRASAEGNFGYTTWTFWPSSSGVYVYDELQGVLTGDTTPREYCDGLAEAFAEDREDNAVPNVPKPGAA